MKREKIFFIIIGLLLINSGKNTVIDKGPVYPVNVEQLFIYELNRARYNPLLFGKENGLGNIFSGIASQPPLAINNNLCGSARYKATEMAINNYFGHKSPYSGQPNKLIRECGYILASMLSDDSNNCESICAGSYDSYKEPLEPLKSLLVDSGTPSLGHRYHLLAIGAFWEKHREIGVGFCNGPNSKYENYWVIHTAWQDDKDLFLTGVVFNDLNKNNRYDLDEGIDNVNIDLGNNINTKTNNYGGWSINVARGEYLVKCKGEKFKGTPSVRVKAESNNIEIDFISGVSYGYVNFKEQENED